MGVQSIVIIKILSALLNHSAGIWGTTFLGVKPLIAGRFRDYKENKPKSILSHRVSEAGSEKGEGT
jgi:hypothetical protein